MLTPAHVEIYVHIRADGFRHFGYRIDEALSFCQQVERRLEKLPLHYRRLILWQGMGYTQAEMAQMIGKSSWTVNDYLKSANRLAFGELMRTIGGMPTIREGYNREPRKNTGETNYESV
ncbi:MAG TPA: hypothetical protein VFN53_06370 [Acidobacteriaceae bacterium]|nr:hypothetical protein [Acidobacteriaceae bacterium]